MRNYDVLIVDDRCGIRRLLYEVLNDDGYRVAVAAGGQEALKIASNFRPRVILLDIKMPGMSGLETLKELRNIYSEFVVVLITAYGNQEIFEQAKKLDVHHYINKPFDFEEIRLLMRFFLLEGLPQLP
ncbi:response regulator receiver protein [Desulfofarcimen acetoxidans DSM 771]|uniref:Stage 0 sporulation protein A homolog n=1 Tax=Desulfofarcimen acetoxidans (strain ATCC 49208 / DSM 771 / KCTC 5769 / VKM B-1644 / 5575) TaxID=485916 RepID=C8VYC8_DESAS|nr:response regulator [Desulfofarcimen acetoxidans]ACV62809.1 response regulator receiver protein [Desulfofarcimen acetoxidans DSM 771]